MYTLQHFVRKCLYSHFKSEMLKADAQNQMCFVTTYAFGCTAYVLLLRISSQV